MIHRTRGLSLVAALVTVMALIIMFPARVAYHWVSSPFVSMSGVQGTVWSGNAQEFSTNGVYLRDLTWTIRPLHLFTGRGIYDVSATPASGFFESEVGVGLGGNLSLRNLSASLPLQMLEKASNIPGLQGQVSLQLERLDLVDGRPTAMDGTLDIANLKVPMLSSTTLGGYRAEFFTQNNGIVASIEDTDGVFDLAGSLQLNPDKSYAFIGQVIAKPGAPELLKQQLQLMPANDRGQREIRLEGTY